MQSRLLLILVGTQHTISDLSVCVCLFELYSSEGVLTSDGKGNLSQKGKPLFEQLHNWCNQMKLCCAMHNNTQIQVFSVVLCITQQSFIAPYFPITAVIMETLA